MKPLSLKLNSHEKVSFASRRVLTLFSSRKMKYIHFQFEAYCYEHIALLFRNHVFFFLLYTKINETKVPRCRKLRFQCDFSFGLLKRSGPGRLSPLDNDHTSINRLYSFWNNCFLFTFRSENQAWDIQTSNIIVKKYLQANLLFLEIT